LTKAKICLITPGHLATNPRLVKEVSTLIEMGHQVHLVFTQYIDKLKAEDHKIIEKYAGLTYNVLDWCGTNNLSYLLKIRSGLLQKLSKKLLKVQSKTVLKNLAINRHFFWQLKKAVASKADLYIAHNLGALPVALYAAKKNNAKCGFDAEDFHRFELSDDKLNEDVQLKISIEEKYLPLTSYLTAASPLIAEAYQQLFNRQVTSILNVFPHADIPIKAPSAQNLRLCWFSQTIGPNRGLETMIAAIGKLGSKSVELNLLGECSEEYKLELIKLANLADLGSDQLIFHATISPDDLIKFAAQFDIGLASEPGFSTNNNIALSNKIFTYLQARLAILASDTMAQASLIGQHPTLGVLYTKNDPQSLALHLSSFLDTERLFKAKKNSAELAETFNWEKESLKFKRIVNQALQ
jgi:glycosyltransferase involved in cell wall biosynthesis